MLTPEYLSEFSQEYLGVMDSLQTAVIEDVARRIVKYGHLTETSEHQVQVLLESDMVYDEVIERLSQVTGESEDMITEMFEDAGIESVRNDNQIYYEAFGERREAVLSDSMSQFLAASAVKTAGELQNLTMTTASNMKNTFIDALDEAYMEVGSGAMSYEQAIRKAILKCADSGLKVTYPSGYVSSLDVAVRRAILTGVNQAAAEMSLMNCRLMDTKYVETTAHAGARPTHVPWQGRVFCLEDGDPEYPNFYTETRYGDVSGLCGANCRHSFHPFFPGISSRAYSDSYLSSLNRKEYEYNGKEYTEYEAQQYANKGYYQIRKTKERLAGLNSAIKESTKEQKKVLQEKYSELSAKLKTQEAAVKKFCRSTGRSYNTARTQVVAVKDSAGKIVGFDRSASQKAVQAAKRYEKRFEDERRYAKMEERIKNAGIRGKISLEPEQIDTSDFFFDDIHINNEREHNVTKEEAQEFIRDADFTLTRWNGRFVNYYGKHGATFVDVENKIIKTSFKEDEFDERTKEMRKAVEDYVEGKVSADGNGD